MRRWRSVFLLSAFVIMVSATPALAGASVPFKGTDAGAWGQGDHDCGALFPIHIAGSGVASHTGRYDYVALECLDLSDYPFPYEGTFMITAANGDTIVGTYSGTAVIADDNVTILYEQQATVTGGTGRFSGVTGTLAVAGIAYEHGAYVQQLTGRISSVGASKRHASAP
jgi:hypothetical protein